MHFRIFKKLVHVSALLVDGDRLIKLTTSYNFLPPSGIPFLFHYKIFTGGNHFSEGTMKADIVFLPVYGTD